MKYEAAKYNMHVSIKPAPNIKQILKSDRDKIEPMKTLGIHLIEFNKDNKTGYCIGLIEKENLKKELKNTKEITQMDHLRGRLAQKKRGKK